MKVTLVSGFLGSGKTSLLRHVLVNRSGLRCAVIVNEISDINIDRFAFGGQVLKREQKLLEMSSGCICCTLRDDLLKQLVELAESQLYDYVLIESSGVAEPMQTAETFFLPVPGKDVRERKSKKKGSEASGSIFKDGTLQGVAPLDNCITVVDATTFRDYLCSTEDATLLEKRKDACDDRCISRLLFDQLEFANVILLNKIDLLPSKNRDKEVGELCAMIRAINPSAHVIPTTNSEADLAQILNTSFFNEAFAKSMAGWMDDVRTGEKHVPETVEYGVSSVVFSSTRPFHPQRLHDWLINYFVLNQMVLLPAPTSPSAAGKTSKDEANEWKVKAAQRAARRNERYGNVFRTKGFALIGNPSRINHFASWSSTGDILTLFPGGTWTSFPHPSGKTGETPGQKLVFIGQFLRRDNLLKDLEALLLNDKEEKLLAEKTASAGFTNDVFPDPLEPFVPRQVAKTENTNSQKNAKRRQSKRKRDEP